MSITNKIEFNINSKYRINFDNSTASNFNYELNIPQYLLTELNMCSVVYGCIPKSYYNIEEEYNRNMFVLWVQGVGNINISLTEGTYQNSENPLITIYDIKVELKNKLDALGYGVWTISNYEYPYRQTGKLQFHTTDNTNKSFLFNVYDNDLYQTLGFDKDSNIIFTNDITSTNVINMNQESILYLVSDISNTDNNDFLGNGIIETIYPSQSKMMSYVIFSNNILENFRRINITSTKNFNFRLLNSNGREVILHGCEISFTLIIFTYTPHEYIYDKISKYIDYKIFNEK